MGKQILDRLEIVLKLTERCNLNCDYCYFFNGGDTSYRKHPACLTLEKGEDVARFISRSFDAGEINSVQVDYHGGEPLLIGKQAFRDISECLRAAAPADKLSLCLQTNATMVDDDWIDLFERFDVKVSTSLDGPQYLNDVHRKFHNGRSSYDATRQGAAKLVQAHQSNRITSLGCLCVIDPRHSASEIYRHLVHEIGFTLVDFLFPDHTHDTFPFLTSQQFGIFLCSLFDCWTRDDNPAVRVRILQSVLSLLMGGRSFLMGFGPNLPKAVTVTTSGEVQPDDFLRTCYPELMNTGLTIDESSAWTAIYSSRFSELEKQAHSLPSGCDSCGWRSLCCGGQMTHRYSRTRKFDNPSVYCEALRMLYEHTARYLVSNGMRIEWLKKVLNSEPEAIGCKPTQFDVFGAELEVLVL